MSLGTIQQVTTDVYFSKNVGSASVSISYGQPVEVAVNLPNVVIVPGVPSVPMSAPNESEYTEDQFMADLKKARAPLTAMADKARKSMKDGSARKFPG